MDGENFAGVVMRVLREVSVKSQCLEGHHSEICIPSFEKIDSLLLGLLRLKLRVLGCSC